MAYPTKTEFIKLLEERKLREIVNDYVFSGVPYAFRDSIDDYENLRKHLADNLNLQVNDFAIVGSGRIGFSMAPDTFGIPFGPEKDIDVVVVSSQLFDNIWLDLLRIPQTKFASMSIQQKDRVKWHQRNEIYWGRIWPADFLGIAASARRWVEAFRSISRMPRLAYHDTKGRLYRTWEHAELYHMYGLNQVRIDIARRK